MRKSLKYAALGIFAAANVLEAVAGYDVGLAEGFNLSHPGGLKMKADPLDDRLKRKLADVFEGAGVGREAAQKTAYGMELAVEITGIVGAGLGESAGLKVTGPRTYFVIGHRP